MSQEFIEVIIAPKDHLGERLTIKELLTRIMSVNSKLKSQETLNASVTFAEKQDILQINVDQEESTENVLWFTKNLSYLRIGT